MIKRANRTRFPAFGKTAFISIIFALISRGSFVFSEPLVTANLPLLITSVGQSPGGSIVKILCTQNKLEFDFLALANKDSLNKKKYSTIIFAIGSSLKGMGAAGISINEEMARVENLISEAKKQKILLIGMHIEGESRRGGYDEEIITKIAPTMDFLVVREDGNKDKIFNKISASNNIPLRLLEKTLDFSNVIKQIFE